MSANLLVGTLGLAAFAIGLIPLRRVRQAGRDDKIRYLLFELFLLLGGLGYLLGIRLLQRLAWPMLLVMGVNYLVYGGRRESRGPEA